MPDIVMRKAEKKDLLEIQKLLSTYFLDMEGLKSEDFLLAEIDGRVLGCAALVRYSYEEKEFQELHTIAVHPNWKGKRIGSRLAGELISKADPLKLYVRTTAPRFFEKIGFTKLPESAKSELWADCAKCEQFQSCAQSVLKYKSCNESLFHERKQ